MVGCYTLTGLPVINAGLHLAPKLIPIIQPLFEALVFLLVSEMNNLLYVNLGNRVWLIFCILSLIFSGAFGRDDIDRLSLLAFKSDVAADPLGTLSSWNESVPFCNWRGVVCRNQTQRVVSLDLQSGKLAGRLSPFIGNLSFLTSLKLQKNNFSLEIPKELGSLSRLQTLVLSNNSFNGSIPATLSNCSDLQYIGLSGNALVGKLPVELGSLSKLQMLDLTLNYLVGEIPSSFGNLSSLREFRFTRNNIQGSIPASFGQLRSLTHLIIGANNLTGTIPPSIYNLSSLQVFSVPVNQLKGTLPPDLGLLFPKLAILRIHTNQFSGPVPFTISNASNLFVIEIQKNMFEGKMPSLAGLQLQIVQLQENNLGNNDDGDLNFLSFLLNCTNLVSLSISDNNFGGVLPEYISNFSVSLTKIGFGRNYIRGSIPSEIGNLVNLDAFGLESNQLTGHIPSSLGNLQNLGSLFLNMNSLSGEIPYSLGNLTSLGRLNMRLNNLTGNIPSSLGGCQNLLMLALSQNNLNGSIPKEILSISALSIALELSDNYLTGSIPVEVSNLKNLGYLHISNNKLIGQIPFGLGSCTALETLYLDHNFLEGTVPDSLSSLRGIEELDLSHNNLSGEIPPFLGKLPFLVYLNLSFNSFDGEVSTEGRIFNNATGFSIDGNTRLCGGIPALNLTNCNINESKKQNQSPRPRIIIFLTVGLVGLLLISSFLLLCWLRKLRRKTRRKPIESSMPEISLLNVSYKDLLEATNGFSSENLIGIGGFGSVYKGIFDQNDLVVAVKVFNLQNRGASRSFLAECEALRNIRHRNLVSVITACSSIDFQGNDFMALVYEFMPNGSLEEWLHPVDGATCGQRYLNFIKRLNIAIDLGFALDYLHNDCPIKIAHCDLKPSNVLLDDVMTARIGDFGLAKFIAGASFQLASNESRSIGIRGSIGYAPPEYAMGGEVSTQGDLYSYGILLLEMFTGKRPTDDMFEDGLNLHNYVLTALTGSIEGIIDPNLMTSLAEERRNKGNNYFRTQMECLISIFRLGVECSADLPRERKNIRDVLGELSSKKKVVFDENQEEGHAAFENSESDLEHCDEELALKNVHFNQCKAH